MLLCAVLLPVWNVGPLWLVADSISTVACVSCGSSTSLERQSAALFWAPDIHSKLMLYVASSKFHLCTLLLAFCSADKSCQWFMVILYDNFSSLEIVITFYNCIIHSVGFLFCGTPFSLCIHEGV